MMPYPDDSQLHDSQLMSAATPQPNMSPSANALPTSDAQSADPDLTIAHLQASLGMFQRVIDHLPQAIAWKDSSAIFGGCNQAFADAVGLSDPSAIVGQSATTLNCTEEVSESPLYDDKGAVVGILTILTHSSNANLHTIEPSQLPKEPKIPPVATVPPVTVTSDLTSTDEALRANEERLRLLLESIPVMIDAFDAEGNIIIWNSECERVTGYTAAEIIRNPKALEILYPDPDYRDRMLVQWQSLGNNFRNWEWDIGCKDGSSRTILWSNLSAQFPIPGWAGWGIGIDISDRKRSEEALQESRRLLQLVVESIPQSIFWKDQNSVYLGCNQNFAREAGLDSPKVIVGKTDYDMPWSRNLADSNRDLDQQVMTSGQLMRQVKTHQRGDGQDTWLETVKVPLRDRQGKIVGVLGTREDISDRKQAEAILRQSEQQMREQATRERLLNQLIGQISASLDFDTILETTLQEVQNFLHADRCQFAWYQHDVEEPYWEVIKEARRPDMSDLCGSYPVSVIGPLATTLLQLDVVQVDDVETVTDPLWQRFVRLLGLRAVLVIPMQMQSGIIGVLSCSHTTEPRFWSDDEVELLLAIMGQLAIALNQAELYAQSRSRAQALEETLRELQRTQTQMVQSEKMSSLGQLVAGVAHEINNPVNFIYGNLKHADEYTGDLLHLIQLYQQHYPNPVPAIQAEASAIDLDFLLEDLPKLLASMRVGADRIQKIVLSLRNFSRMDEAEVKAVDIHEGIDSTLMILQNRFKARAGQMPIEIVKAYGTLPLVECYPGQLNQVFMNILSNAIDALEEVGEKNQESGVRSQESGQTNDFQIRIQTAVTGTSDAFPQGTHVAIRIADNGPGMTEAQRQRLFDPFFTTKPIGKGTGLGLSISYQIVVEKHGGKLSCRSAPGQGAEFAIEIPMQQQAATG